jgi:hypothetical protein
MSNKGTVFQSTITKEHLIQICQILHPELTQSQLDQLRFSTKYTWVTVEFSAKNYGYISFAIDNHSGSGLYGGGVTKDRIKESLRKKDIKFRIWRFSNDILFTVNQKKDETLYLLARKYIERNYQLPTVDEFYNNYYKD